MFCNSKLHFILVLATGYCGIIWSNIPTLSQDKNSKSNKYRIVEHNVYAPELYVDSLNMQIVLVDLPGADDLNSYCVISYRLFFIAENEYWKAIRQATATGHSIGGASDFPIKTLLVSRKFKSHDLRNIKNRLQVRGNILFRPKIPKKDQTKFATILMSYSIKVYDNSLKTSLYRSGIFLNSLFNEDVQASTKIAPRSTIFLSFLISPKGELYASNLARSPFSTEWIRGGEGRE